MTAGFGFTDDELVAAFGPVAGKRVARDIARDGDRARDHYGRALNARRVNQGLRAPSDRVARILEGRAR